MLSRDVARVGAAAHVAVLAQPLLPPASHWRCYLRQQLAQRGDALRELYTLL